MKSMTPEERIKQIEEEIRKTPYHKGTEHHLGKLKAKLAKLRDQLLTPKKAGKKAGFSLKKEGDASCILLGFPSAGKSTLLNKLTSASSKVGAYEFTTLTVIPGILKFKGAKIQIFDLPGIISGAAKGKGRGKQILSAARVADLLLILLDVSKLKQGEIIKKELYQAGVRINKEKPLVIIKKKARGGIRLNLPFPFSLSQETIKEIAQEFGLVNAEIIIKEDLTLEKLVDAFSQNRVYLPALFVINKIDLIKNPKEWQEKFPDHLFISAKENLGLLELKNTIWEKLKLIRVYLKPKTGEINFKKPLILKKGTTVLGAAEKISSELTKNLKGAKISGRHARYQGQVVGLSYPLADGLILTFLS